MPILLITMYSSKPFISYLSLFQVRLFEDFDFEIEGKDNRWNAANLSTTSSLLKVVKLFLLWVD